MSEPNTPRRRSKRGQPVVAYLPSPSSAVPAEINPSGPLHSRTTTALDLFEDEDHDFDSLDDLHTHFYQSYSRSTNATSARAPLRTYGRVSRPRNSDADAPTVFNLGDTVLVKTASRIPSVAVITALWTVEGDDFRPKAPLRVRVHWFVRPGELPKIRARREFDENEVLYNISACETLPPSAILAHCAVSSLPAKRVTVPEDASPDDLFCHLAVDPMRGLYYALDWDAFRLQALAHHSADADWPADDVWVVKAQAQAESSAREGAQGPRKRRRVADGDRSESEDDASGDEFEALLKDESEDEDAEADDVVAELEPRTPSRKRKRAGTTTPRTPRRTGTASATTTPRRQRKDASLAQPTPHSKAALRKRKKTALAVRPLPAAAGMLDMDARAMQGLGEDPWLRAMHVLHVAARPGALPCRETEYGRVLRAVEELLEEGSGGCIYISGVPGTGKTATVHAVVRELKRMAEQNEANPFAYVEINGLKIPEPAAAYGLLWEAVSGHDAARDGHMKIGAKEALRLLSQHFSGAARVGPAGGHACVVLMDELDQLMTTKQDVVYNFFNWPTLARSKLVVLAVANTMDLPERVMSGRVRSRLGMVRINFQPYTTPQLEQIVRARLAGARLGLPADTPEVLAPDALKFAAMKVSSISGDARRVLDICRRTVELVQARKRTARTEDVKAVIKEMQNSPTAAYLRELAFHERLMLAAVLRCVRKEGVEEIQWASVQHQHLVYLNLLGGSGNDADPDPVRRPSTDELGQVLDALLAAHALICEDGPAVASKAEGERRVALNLEYAEVERVLGEVGGPKWRNALNV
ncbi:Origin recognition complex subunit 1 [Trametes pubescens]|uniref:Origin recognition complex subunit 1 n=1 Tax=Trametes pubescens TaxID=154538 RepID=A0A1M2VJK6_TRAPU|nr:Origin recognition complex subunit 1 [Trametes pubescens]